MDVTIDWHLLLVSVITGFVVAFILRSGYCRCGGEKKKMERTLHGEAELVDEARRLLVSSGNVETDVARAMQALASLVQAVRLSDGDAAAGALLERGRAMFKEREGTDTERDHALESFESQDSLLKERGMEGILEAAFVDGSSVLCRRCSGLVARARWDAHKTQWCPTLTTRHDILEEEDDEADDMMEIE